MPDDSGVIGVVSKLRESIGGWVVKTIVIAVMT